jgi:hypothetical protein
VHTAVGVPRPVRDATGAIDARLLQTAKREQIPRDQVEQLKGEAGYDMGVEPWLRGTTTYLQDAGTIEHTQQMANHESPHDQAL